MPASEFTQTGLQTRSFKLLLKLPLSLYCRYPSQHVSAEFCILWNFADPHLQGQRGHPCCRAEQRRRIRSTPPLTMEMFAPFPDRGGQATHCPLPLQGNLLVSSGSQQEQSGGLSSELSSELPSEQPSGVPVTSLQPLPAPTELGAV